MSKWEGFVKGQSTNNTQSFEILEITDSALETYSCNEEKCIVIFGKIENSSNNTWDKVHFHVELYNSDNELIDVFSELNWDFVLSPNATSSFRISKKAVRDLNEYSSHTIEIRWARKIG
jgi:hypothetical protein